MSGSILLFGANGQLGRELLALAAVAAQAPIIGRRPSVEPIGTADYPTPAQRPANSELDS